MFTFNTTLIRARFDSVFQSWFSFIANMLTSNFIARVWNAIAAFEQSPDVRRYCKTKGVRKAQLLV